jgi:hypothetical protein
LSADVIGLAEVDLGVDDPEAAFAQATIDAREVTVTEAGRGGSIGTTDDIGFR